MRVRPSACGRAEAMPKVGPPPSCTTACLESCPPCVQHSINASYKPCRCPCPCQGPVAETWQHATLHPHGTNAYLARCMVVFILIEEQRM